MREASPGSRRAAPSFLVTVGVRADAGRSRHVAARPDTSGTALSHRARGHRRCRPLGAGHPGSGRATTVYRDVLSVPLFVPLAARENASVSAVPPDLQGPSPAAVLPLVVTVHDLAVLRHPEAFNAWTRHYSAFSVPRVVRAATA
jgi:hypothetical protein